MKLIFDFISKLVQYSTSYSLEKIRRSLFELRAAQKYHTPRYRHCLYIYSFAIRGQIAKSGHWRKLYQSGNKITESEENQKMCPFLSA